MSHVVVDNSHGLEQQVSLFQIQVFFNFANLTVDCLFLRLRICFGLAVLSVSIAESSDNCIDACKLAGNVKMVVASDLVSQTVNASQRW